MIIKFGDYILKPADVLVVKDRRFDLFDHYAVYMGHGKFIAYMRKGITEIYLDEFHNFSGDFYPIRLRTFNGTEFERQQAIRRAKECVLPAYNLLFSNCEHFADYVQTGNKRSLQSAKAGFFLLGGGAMIASNGKSQAAQVIGTLSMIAGIFALINEATGDSNSSSLQTI